MLNQLLWALLFFLCHNLKVRILLHTFCRKAEIFQKFILKSHYSFTLTDIIITNVNSDSNVVATGTNPLKNHQMKIAYFLSLFLINQKLIWNTETVLAWLRTFDPVFVALTSEKPWKYSDLKN